MELRERVLLAVILLGVAGACIAFYLWRDRPSTRAVRLVDAKADVSGCRFIARIVVEFQRVGNRPELARSHNSDVIEAEQQLRMRAATADADTVVVATTDLEMIGDAFHCEIAAH